MSLSMGTHGLRFFAIFLQILIDVFFGIYSFIGLKWVKRLFNVIHS